METGKPDKFKETLSLFAKERFGEDLFAEDKPAEETPDRFDSIIEESKESHTPEEHEQLKTLLGKLNS